VATPSSEAATKSHSCGDIKGRGRWAGTNVSVRVKRGANGCVTARAVARHLFGDKARIHDCGASYCSYFTVKVARREMEGRRSDGGMDHEYLSAPQRLAGAAGAKPTCPASGKPLIDCDGRRE